MSEGEANGKNGAPDSLVSASAEDLSKAIRWDEQGLVPAIVQDEISKDVLMMAYMNKDSLKLTLESGEAWFWSRSRQELWHKGATSGNVQKVRGLSYDCDADTLLVKVLPQGPACHTGTYSCFFNEVKLAEKDSTSELPDSERFAILGKLESLIAARENERPEGAYTTYLFEKGIDKILKKVGEETAEVIIAAKNQDNEELRYEASDLIFHLMVLLRETKLPLDEVLGELERRHIAKPAGEFK